MAAPLDAVSNEPDSRDLFTGRAWEERRLSALDNLDGEQTSAALAGIQNNAQGANMSAGVIAELLLMAVSAKRLRVKQEEELIKGSIEEAKRADPEGKSI